MDEPVQEKSRLSLRVSIIVLLTIAYVTLGIYFHAVLHQPIIYTHLAYIPIVLSGIWWGRKGIIVAGVLAGLTVSFHLLGIGAGALWSDILRTAFFFLIAATVGILSEKVKNREKELRLSEKQLIHSTRLAELGEMAAGIAHELNQPLTGIKTFAKNALYMLETGTGSSQDVCENLRLTSEQVDRAAKIISQMRELTRKSAREFAPVNINQVIRESVEFLMPQMTLAGVTVSSDLAGDLPESMAERIRLEQVFLNLLTNARQAMEDSPTRHLGIVTRFDRAGKLPIVIEISDTGKGFGKDEVGKVFMPFYSTKKPGHGTGLGLSISLSIIEAHDGTIEADGKPGEGACFVIRLPISPKHNTSRGEHSR